MDSKSKDHQQFLSELDYFDLSQFIVNSNHSLIGTSRNVTKCNGMNESSNELNDMFSMQHTKQFHQLKQFIQKQQCAHMPLLIKSGNHSGKKTLLCQLLNHYQKQSTQKSGSKRSKLFISNFSAVTKSYSQILYNIMFKMRLHFDIKQKVEVNEEKIRRYFSYWLDITSQKIQKENIGYDTAEKQVLIIVIDGIEELTNQKGETMFPQFWLPQKVPTNIRLILSGNSKEPSIQRLQQSGKVKILNFSQKNLIEKYKRKLKPQIQSLFISRELSLEQIKILNSFLSLKAGFKIAQDDTFDTIMQNYISACASDKLKVSQIKSLILCLSLSKKGLTLSELKRIMKLSESSIEQFLSKFQPLISKFKNFYLIINSMVKDFIAQNYDPQSQKKQIYHEIIATVLKKDQASIRKLEQEIHHLLQAKKYFQMKEVITQIQNFLVLYTPPCKHLLCTSWKILQNQLNSDPVFEYNKSVQSFLTHYHPKEEQVFKIIYQLSMFFREYSDFQSAKIPLFRHPAIKGDEEQLQQISVYQQFKQLNMTTGLKQFQDKKTRKKQAKKDDQKTEKLSKKSTLKQKTKKVEKAEVIQKDQTSQQLIISSKQVALCQVSVQQLQSSNLQVKLNRQRFRLYYLSYLQPYLREYYLPIKKTLLNNQQFLKSAKSPKLKTNRTHQSEDELDQIQGNEPMIDGFIQQGKGEQFAKVKDALVLKNLDEYFEENYHRQEQTKFYYYKEWIWIQFPWICQALNSNFSEMIQQFIGKPTQYMSIERQISFVRNVLKISKVSKQSKSAIYEKKAVQLYAISIQKLNKKKNQLRQAAIKNSIIDQHLDESKNQNKNLVESKIKKENFKSQSVKNHSNTINVPKFELDITVIDDKLKTQIVKESASRCVYDSRQVIKAQSRANFNNSMNLNRNQSSAFLTESVNTYGKQNRQSTKLPYLPHNMSQSRITMSGSRSSSIIKPLESFQVRESKNLIQLNNLISCNKKLTHTIQQLQKTSIMLDSIDVTTPVSVNGQKKQVLLSQKQKLQQKYQIQQKLKQKLETIIKICDNNQSHQKQSQSLNHLLNGLKQMNKIERDNIQIINRELVEFVQSEKQHIRLLKNQRNNLQKDFSLQFGQIHDQTVEQGELKHNIIREIVKTARQKQNQQSRIPLKSTKGQLSVLKSSMINMKSTIKKSPSVLGFKRSMNQASKSLKTLSSPIFQQLNSIFHISTPPASTFCPSQPTTKHCSTLLLQQFREKILKLKELQMNRQDLSYEENLLIESVQTLQEELRIAKEKADLKLVNQQGDGLNSRRYNHQTRLEIAAKKKNLNQLRQRKQVLVNCRTLYA